ncbi:hypothetical protein B0H14DRAFT_3666254 [Mycena olivaceomarginata]|nr:hypothetical protein B0H14DRAFT_3666254 [Mycena olivaceomarginata]
MASEFGLSSATGKHASPKLAQGGANFVSYKEKMTEFLTGQPGFRKHLMGRVKPPTKPADLKEGATKAEKDAYETAMEAHEDEMDEYLQKQAAIASILTNSWPDDVHQQLLGIRPVHKLWSSLCALYENKSVLGMVDILVDLLRIECTGDEDEDVLAVIDCFIKKRNEYISTGGQLPDDVYAAFLIKAMPSAYRSTILTTLKEAIQFDVAQANRKREEAKAMAAKFERHKQQQQGQQPQQSKKKKCANCSYTGHTKEECRKPGGDMEGVPLPPKKDKGSAKGKGKAAAAEDKPSDASEHHAYVAAAIPDRPLRTSGGKTIRLLDTDTGSQDEEKLMAEYRKMKEAKEKGTRVSNKDAARDVTWTVDQMLEELPNLEQRTGARGIVLVAGSHPNDTIVTTCIGSDESLSFVSSILKMPPSSLASKFEAFNKLKDKGLENVSFAKKRSSVVEGINDGLLLKVVFPTFKNVNAQYHHSDR